MFVVMSHLFFPGTFFAPSLDLFFGVDILIAWCSYFHPIYLSAAQVVCSISYQPLTFNTVCTHMVSESVCTASFYSCPVE